ncbi:hypothetical protein ID866_6718 [Astraeus odoratus]|nr:hypothetical protein ID866_6718 [Astraeus odoratus]
MHSGSCCIYKGVLEPGRTQVAVKVVRYTDQDPVPILKVFMVQRTLREVHVWSKLNHNNILPLLGVTTKLAATVSLVSPWMPKGNAFEYVQNRVIDPRPLILDIAQGLRYLHSHQEGPIFHGDLKGTNVLISTEGRALLSDFGFSLLVGGRPRDCVRPGDALNWMPPEYLESDECTMSAEGDVWSFGMTALVRL